jgi:hypothetical protein
LPFSANKEASMTSDGPYPPGYEPADGPPYGRYPTDEPDGRGQQTPPGRAQGSWAPPQEDYFTPPGDRFSAPGADRFTPPAYPPPGPTAGAGGDRPGSYPSRTGYGGGWQPENQSGFGGGFGSSAASHSPEPPRGPDSSWPADPNRPTSPPPTGRISGSASVGSASVGSASVGGPSAGNQGGPTGASGRASTPGVYGAPTQYGTPAQYGGGNRPGEYGAPTTQFAGGPGQYGEGAGQYGGAAGAGTGQFGGNQPGQYGAPVGGPGQYGGNQAGQYGAPGQYGSAPDPAMARFRPGSGDEPGDGQPEAKNRRGLIIGLAIAGVVIVALIAVAVVASMSGDKSGDYAVGKCVKQSGDTATSVACSESGAYSIVNKVDSASKCDQSQPYVLLQRSGVADQVLCLKPAH